MANASDSNGVLDSTIINNSNARLSFYDNDFGISYGKYLIVVLVVSTTCCILPVINLIRTKRGMFFAWKVIDRFSMYTMVTDLMFYFAQTLYGSMRMYFSLRYSQHLPQLQCTVSGFLLLSSANIQQLLNIGTALFVACLVLRNQHLNLGKYDWRLLLACIFPSLLTNLMAAFYDQFQANPSYCGYKEEGVFSSVKFGILVFSILNIVFIIGLYLAMFIFVKYQQKKNEEMLKQSALNALRLAYKLSLYVAVYFVQFGGYIVESMLVAFTGDVPDIGRVVITFLTTSGGIVNAIVYYFIRET